MEEERSTDKFDKRSRTKILISGRCLQSRKSQKSAKTFPLPSRIRFFMFENDDFLFG